MPKPFVSSINQLRAALRGKQADELLATLRRQIESIEAPALAADNSSRYVATNAPARALTGYSDAELRKMTVMDLTPWPARDAGRLLWQQFIIEGTQEGEYELRRKDGSHVRVQYWACASVAPGIHLSLLTALNATRRRPRSRNSSPTRP